MSASREGARLAREGQRLTETMMDGVVTGTTDFQQAQGGAAAYQLPRKFDARSRMDDEMATRMQLADDKGNTPFGQLMYDDRVGKWLERKADAVEAANLDAWFNKEFNRNNLADRQFAQQIHPGFYESREREMRERTEEILNLKMIELRGPRSKEDLYKLWLINTGRVVLPKDWDRIGGSAQTFEAATQEKNFKAGLIRVPKFTTEKERTANAEQLRAAGLWGNPAKAANTFKMGAADATNGLFASPPNSLAESFLRTNLGMN